MAAFEIRSYKPGDFDHLTPQIGQANEHEAWRLMVEQGLGDPHTVGESIVVSCDDDVLMAGGIIDHYHGRGLMWALFSDKVGIHDFRRAHYACKSFISDCLDEGGYHRLEAHVRSDWPAAVRWIEALGFIREGKMRAYGPHKEDYLLYAKVEQ